MLYNGCTMVVQRCTIVVITMVVITMVVQRCNYNSCNYNVVQLIVINYREGCNYKFFWNLCVMEVTH